MTRGALRPLALRLLRWYFLRFHRARVLGLENYHAAGDRVVIVCNHLSYADAALLSAFLPEDPAFAIHSHQLRQPWVRLMATGARVFPVDIANPFSVRRMIEAVRDGGEKLVIFPEGRITVTGARMKVFDGAAVIADRAGAVILPIHIDGTQFSRFGHMRGKLKMHWFPRLRMTVHKAVRLTPATEEGLPPRRRRQLAARALEDAMALASFRSQDIDRTLLSAVLQARGWHGGKAWIVEDINRAPLRFNRLLIGAFALGRALCAATRPGEAVGLMLPTANATLLSFLGLSAFARVPAMLNFSAGAEGMLAACAAAGVRTVISSRAFVEKARLQKIVAQMSPSLRFVWLEEVRDSIGTLARLRAMVTLSRAQLLPGATGPAGQAAVILFTSGSEGTPKGVALSHRNILANCAQLAAVIDFNPTDRVFNALPMFHSFGLVSGTLLPLLNGVRTFLYPSPLHYRTVPALIYDTDATICFSTDSFLNGWATYAHPYDFYRMRYIFAGAEKVREETKNLYAQKFGVRVLEGYGATESSPVLAMNTAMHARPGTVGRLLPDISARLEPIDGIDIGGRLFVRGPNIMLGYLSASSPGETEAPAEGWYDTGDIVQIDADGFVAITGRVKRFAKIGGEMVSLAAAEALAGAVWPAHAHAVLAVPDARKGERLLLVTTHPEADIAALLAHAQDRGMAEIAVPRATHHVLALPLLGSGKIDYPALRRTVAEGRKNVLF